MSSLSCTSPVTVRPPRWTSVGTGAPTRQSSWTSARCCTLDDAVASKVTALLGRGLARDYIDVAAALDRYPRRRLLQLTFERDPGLRVLDVALAAQRLDQLPDGRFGRYGLDPDQVLIVRAHFADWPRDSTVDQIAQAAHDAAHRRDRSAAQLAAAAYPVPLDQVLGQPGPPPPTPPAPSPDPQLRNSYDRHGG